MKEARENLLAGGDNGLGQGAGIVGPNPLGRTEAMTFPRMWELGFGDELKRFTG